MIRSCPAARARPYRPIGPIGRVGRQFWLSALPVGTRPAAPVGRWRCQVFRCCDRRDSTDVTGYTDVRTYVSQIIRQNCRLEASYSMHIAGAIAFKTNALPCANLMITHMGFHAMPPAISGQGRVTQLVNPLSTCSLFDVPLMTPGGAKSQVAACSHHATRRFGRGRRTGPGRPRSGRDRRAGPTAGKLGWSGVCTLLG